MIDHNIVPARANGLSWERIDENTVKVSTGWINLNNGDKLYWLDADMLFKHKAGMTLVVRFDWNKGSARLESVSEIINDYGNIYDVVL